MDTGIFFDLATDMQFWAVLAVALIAGLVRGFSGFGAGLIFVPAASAFYSPKIAVIAIWIMDSLPTLVILPKALPHVDWRTVIPAAVGYAIAVRFGVAVLSGLDPYLMRWMISFIAFAFLLLLWSGWRYLGKRPAWLSTGVGGLAGLFGGAAALPGPPVIAYWMASSAPVHTVRANLIAFFLAGETFSGIAFYFGELFTEKAVALGILTTPVYAGGLLAGQAMFSRSSGARYRQVALAIILASVILGLPLFDPLLR